MVMLTDFVYLQGKCKWFRNKTPNQWGKWSHDLYLDEKSVAKFRELQETQNDVQGIKTHLKRDDDGYYVSLSRPVEKIYSGKRTGLVPPSVVDSNGVEFDDLVGNGSDITSKIEVYVHRVPAGGGRARAIRWVSSRIDNLVPYEGVRDRKEAEAKMLAGIEDQPKQINF